MKKIAHIYSSWTAGGAEKIMLSLAAGLERAGYLNFIVAPGDSYLFSQARRMEIAACPIVIKGSFDPIGIVTLWRIVSRNKIDIIHAHQGKVFWPCIIVKMYATLLHVLCPRSYPGIPMVVFHRHADLPHRFYSRWHYTLADQVVAISNAVAQGLIAREKVAPEKISVVYNGTDFEQFSPAVSGEAVRREYHLENTIVVGTVAAMNKPKGKGQGYLIEAAALLRTRFPDARYLIVGTGDILEELKESARRQGVDDIVFFTGYQESVEKYIAAMDVFCFLSWDTEGFGQVMVEAQAMGKPVIGTDIGGIPETFKNGTTGICIPPENTDAVVSAITLFLGDPVRRRDTGVAAQSFVRERFGMKQMIDQTIAVYERR
ncbi:MAG: glycosyltransferase family 4 protein [Elusimicrobia bacterium]|nr:glycosyltransferase family 4 protein [Elusimicrobiota bacterium]